MSRTAPLPLVDDTPPRTYHNRMPAEYTLFDIFPPRPLRAPVQLDPNTPGLDPDDLPPELQLVAAVFRRADMDLGSTNAQYRAEAEAWFRGHRGSLRLWCDLVGVEPEGIRQLVAS